MTRDYFLLDADRVPPIVCRMVSVVGKIVAPRKRTRAKCPDVRRLTVVELVERSGIPRRSFLRISRKSSWKGVKPELISGFSYACGVDLRAKNPLARFKKYFRPGLPYFTKAQRVFFDKYFHGK